MTACGYRDRDCQPEAGLPDGGAADRHRSGALSGAQTLRHHRSNELPGSPRFYTYASGVAEVGVGTMLLVPQARRAGALAAVALFLAVFPANVNMVRMWWNKPGAQKWPMRDRRAGPAALAGADDRHCPADPSQRSASPPELSSAASSSRP